MAILEIWGKESLGIDFMQSIFSNQIHQCPPVFFCFFLFFEDMQKWCLVAHVKNGYM